MLTGSGPSQPTRTEAQHSPYVRLLCSRLKAPLGMINPNTSHPASSVLLVLRTIIPDYLYVFAPGDGDIDVTECSLSLSSSCAILVAA